MKSRIFAVCLGMFIVAGPCQAQLPTTTTTAPTTTTTTTTGTGGLTSGLTQGGQQGGLGTQGQTSANQIKIMTNGAGSTTTIPSNSNPFVGSYIDPISAGMPSKFPAFVASIPQPSGSFGTPLYTTSTTGAAAATGAPATTTQQLIGFTTLGTPRAPVYQTVLADDVPRIVHQPADLHARVQAMIDRSTYLKSKQNVRISVEGATVQLQGVVGSEKERKMVEGMIRTQPGVQDVLNQIQVVVQAK